ncbi:hypothetical protein CL653_01810 [bacterium]|nr:hypothetical protein [bacterium]|tara:strand:+ start:335 stop:814 length:480 start_codon:yes stop_codon:yes gene_type:complete
MFKNVLIVLLLVLIVALGYGLVWSTQKVSNLEAELDLMNEQNNDSEEMMEEEVVALDLERSIATLVGSWQSTEDEKSVVVFNVDGTARDIYEEEEVSSDKWQMTIAMDYNNAPALHLTRSNEEDTVLEYVVWTLDNEKLVMNFLDSGNTLEYTRIPEVQ